MIIIVNYHPNYFAQPLLEKENFKPAELHFDIDLISDPACGGGG